MSNNMKYADIEGLEKKDLFKKGFIDLLQKTVKSLSALGLGIVPESLGEPATLIDFKADDFYLAFKTDGVGTKSLIADTMAKEIRKNRKNIPVSRLYAGLGIDLIASNVNDLICLGAKPIALSDEIAAGDYHTFTDKQLIEGLYKGLQDGCLEAEITIPSGESPTLVDIINKGTISLTASSLGIIRPKNQAILGNNLQAGDAIFGLVSSGIHTNGLSLARRIAEKLPQGYFTPFNKNTIGEELLTPTKIYVKPIMTMLKKGIEIHYMSHISGSAFRKIARAKKEFTYLIEKVPEVPDILKYLQKKENIPDNEAYETWNMGLGFVIFAPENEEKKIKHICQKFQVGFLKMGFVEKGKKQVVIKPKTAQTFLF